ncbi:LisH motif-containing protein [Phaffia rhodozyma]|uniref:LisH motif-containing protein n=1 Tax=Phaffia rhodozyma TaxID=264483 RepID=A0A0F7SRV6_PHARH|nr:LisH motif-containing protein [Phaffia rhodozyma]
MSNPSGTSSSIPTSFSNTTTNNCSPAIIAAASTSTTKKPMAPAEWSRRLAEVEFDRTDLNRLVMDYLIVEGYRDAAEEFAKELRSNSDRSQTRPRSLSGQQSGAEDPDGMQLDPTDDGQDAFNLEGIEERMLIREAVEAGRIDEAICRVNELDPEILDTHSTLYFHLQLQRLIELLRTSTNSNSSSSPTQALLFASQTLAPLAASHPSHLVELELVLTLLAFPPPGPYPSTDIAQLVSQDQRRKVSKELNAAILESAGRGVESRLMGALRLLAWGEGVLKSKERPIPEVEGIWKTEHGVSV